RGRSVSASAAAAIVIQHVTKLVGQTAAVADLTLEVAAGVIYGLLGPNGAGKTTALRVLGGIREPSAGRVTVAGIEVGTRSQAAKQRLGYLTGSTGLYARLTAR